MLGGRLTAGSLCHSIPCHWVVYGIKTAYMSGLAEDEKIADIASELASGKDLMLPSEHAPDNG